MCLADRHTFFINAHALHAIEIVEDQTLAAADDNYFADFIGVRPAYVNIPDDVVRVAKSDEGDILAGISQGARADGARPLRLLVEQIVEDGNVVRGQIPHGIDVWAYGAEVRARGVQVIDTSKIGGFDEFAQLLNSGIVKESVRDHEDEAFFIG